MPSKEPLEMIMFDMDGVIIDSQHFHTMFFKRFIEKFGKKISYDEARYLIGKTIQYIFDMTIPVERHSEASIKLGEFYNDTDDLIGKITVTPGFHDTLESIRSKGIKTALVTNSKTEAVKKILDIKNIGTMFDIVSPAELSDLSKHERCKNIIDKFSIKPSCVLFVGDLPSDINLAKDMGFNSCIVFNKISWLYPDKKLANAQKADYLLNDITQLRDIIEQSN